MKKASVITAAILGISVAGAGLAMAQEGPGNPGEHPRHERGPRGANLKAMDLNGDGNVTKDELASFESQRFAEMDLNGDGNLTTTEMTEFREMKRAEMLAKREERRQAGMLERFDTDGDGAISQAEFAAKPNPMFDRADADGDGIVTEDERKAMRQAFAEKRGNRGERWKARRERGQGYRDN